MFSEKFKQGFFKPRNPQKYKGNSDRIIFRSTYEYAAMKFFDDQVNIIEWASEEKAIPYKNPVTKRVSRYFPDFFVKLRNKDGQIESMIIEVKPKSKLLVPFKKPNGSMKSYNFQLKEYLVNMAKFEQATKYAEDRGMTFKIMTEEDLFGK